MRRRLAGGEEPSSRFSLALSAGVFLAAAGVAIAVALDPTRREEATDASPEPAGAPPAPSPPPPSISLVVPARGSEYGREIVTIRGESLGRGAAPPVVAIGDSAARIVDVREDRIRVRAPRGRGAADVRVTIDGIDLVLEEAYRYGPTHLEALRGRVNRGRGAVEDVVFVNGSSGGEPERLVRLKTGESIEVEVKAPPSRERARYAVYGWRGAPRRETVSLAIRGMGALVFPTPFTRLMPNADETTPREPDMAVIWNNTGNERWLGPADVSAPEAPGFMFRRPRGLRHAATFTFQGVIEDDGSEMSFGWSITNAVVVEVRG